MEKLAVNLLIKANKSVITGKRSLITVILSIKPNQVINKTRNAKSQNIKVLIIMKV